MCKTFPARGLPLPDPSALGRSSSVFTHGSAMHTLVWLRSDLRAADNSALHHAARHARASSPSARVVALFILSPGEWAAHDWAPVKVDFALRTLRELSGTLAHLGIPLLIRSALTPADVVPAVLSVAAQASCSAIHFNREYELNESRRDTALLAAAKSRGIAAFAHHDQCLLEPGSVLTQTGTPFTVFTPFKRRCFDLLAERGIPPVLPAPAPFPPSPAIAAPDGTPSSIPGFASSLPASLWPAGENEAHRRLRTFVDLRIHRYKADRDRPDLDGTSTLSPYLTIGAISIRQCLAAALAANNNRLDAQPPPATPTAARGHEGPACWITELIWRDFYRHILAAFPRLCTHRAFKPATDRLTWRTDTRELDAWTSGRTGYPIVDAAMRQLAATGWMHNRLRMISAMFLTKDLLIDWRAGERHFMQSLIDGDLASNNGGWQWSASTGTDAAPYFRIFNPASQSRKVDPDGAFIRRYVPELASLEGDAIHEPALLPPLLRARLDYPMPIVDHAFARNRTLAAFKGLAAHA